MINPPLVAFAAITDVWPCVKETEIDTALCATGHRRTSKPYKVTIFFEFTFKLKININIYFVVNLTV